MNEMTTAGDVGSGTGSEPMVKYGEKPLRRKAHKKLKTFKEYALDVFKTHKTQIWEKK